jgi:hypothetical protein
MKDKKNPRRKAQDAAPDRIYRTEREEREYRELKERFGVREAIVVQGSPEPRPAENDMKRAK